MQEAMLFHVDVLPIFGHYCRPVSILYSDMFYSCFKIMFASMITILPWSTTMKGITTT